jgi:hypothetical protein
VKKLSLLIPSITANAFTKWLGQLNLWIFGNAHLSYDAYQFAPIGQREFLYSSYGAFPFSWANQIREDRFIGKEEVLPFKDRR